MRGFHFVCSSFMNDKDSLLDTGDSIYHPVNGELCCNTVLNLDCGV